MAKQVPLTQGYVATVDDADYDDVMQHKWQVHKQAKSRTAYAQRQVRTPGGKPVNQSMHRYLTGYPETDHHDGDGLNNQRANLRLATRGQNVANRPTRGGTSRYKGVSWHSRRQKWQAHGPAQDGRKRNIYLGYFGIEEDAARAFDEASRARWGEFAVLNFPREGERSALSSGDEKEAADGAYQNDQA